MVKAEAQAKAAEAAKQMEEAQQLKTEIESLLAAAKQMQDENAQANVDLMERQIAFQQRVADAQSTIELAAKVKAEAEKTRTLAMNMKQEVDRGSKCEEELAAEQMRIKTANMLQAAIAERSGHQRTSCS